MIRDKHLLEIVPVKGRGYSIKSRTYVPNEKVHESNGKFFYRGEFENNIKSVIEFSTNEGTNALTEVMGVAGTFENPKNVGMIMYLLNIVKKIILLYWISLRVAALLATLSCNLTKKMVETANISSAPTTKIISAKRLLIKDLRIFRRNCHII